MQTSYTSIMLAIGALTTKAHEIEAVELDTYTRPSAGIFNAFFLAVSDFLRPTTFDCLRFPKHCHTVIILSIY